MSGYTKGEWIAGPPQWSRARRSPETQKRAITAPNQPVIANVYGEANARVIAAAPDLLEALQRLMEWAAPIAGDNNDREAAAEEDASIEQALAAIAKAITAEQAGVEK